MIASSFRRIAPQGAETAARTGERPSARRFLRDVRGGATSIMATFVAVMVVGAAALIVDHNWLVDQRDTMKNASDAAAVAATIEMTRPGVQSKSDSELAAHLKQVAETYVMLNLSHLSGEQLEKAKDSLDVNVTPKRASNTVEVSVSSNLGGTLFSLHLPIMGNYTGPAKIGAVASVESTSNPIEVVLAIDISRSMASTLEDSAATAGSESRIAIVKRAAKSLVDIVGPNAKNRVAVGLVPWQAQVRLDGATQEVWSMRDWVKYPTSRHYDAPYACRPQGSCSIEERVDYAKSQDLPQEPEHEIQDWLGCLDEHRVDAVGHANLPAAQTEAALMSLPEKSAFAQGIYISQYARAYECLQLPLPGDFKWQYCYGTNSREAFNLDVWWQSGQYFCFDDPATILPLTSDASEVRARIDSLKVIGSNTYSALGVLWGQRLLSHSWKDVWGDSVHPVDPASENSTGARKAIVLLTDGEDGVCGYHDPSCTTNKVGIARETACSIAKKAGIEVFVIAAMHPDEVSRKLGDSLRACSSQTDNPDGKYVFLNNADAESLETAFADIANQLKVFRRVY